ncbi:MAG: hypothetical protein ACXVH1_38370 [Solirubrobacteraceae bacterium]
MLTVGDRFWSKVNKQGPILVPELGRCRAWTGLPGSGGYGQFRLSNPRRLVYAHRFAYELDATGDWLVQARSARRDVGASRPV